MTTGYALAILFTLGWLVIFVFRVETVRAAFPHYDRNERFWVLVTPAVLGAHFTLGCFMSSAEPSMAVSRAAASAAVFVAGVSVWFWGRSGVGPLRVRRLPSEAPSEFRRDGAFALVRNPMFFGTLLASLAPVLATPRLSLLSSFAFCAVALCMCAIQDERRLHRQLGPAYAQYCQEVKRLIPFIW